MKFRCVGQRQLHLLMIVETACFASAQSKLEVCMYTLVIIVSRILSTELYSALALALVS